MYIYRTISYAKPGKLAELIPLARKRFGRLPEAAHLRLMVAATGPEAASTLVAEFEIESYDAFVAAAAKEESIAEAQAVVRQWDELLLRSTTHELYRLL